MKYLKRTLGVLFAGLILFILWAILFPKSWMKIISPIKYDILKVDMRVTDRELLLDFDVLVTGDYLIDFIFDSLEYKIYFDSTQFSSGKTTIDKTFRDGQRDTLHMPLVIDRSSLKSKMSSLDDDAKVELHIWFKNYISLPIAGNTTAIANVRREINAPSAPEISVVNLERQLLNLHDAVFNIEFAMYNPNAYEFVIRDIEAKLDFKDLFSGRARSMEQVRVPPNDTAFFMAKVDIDELELIRDGLRVAFRPNKMWPYSIEAKLSIRQKDSTDLIMTVFHDSEMELMGRRKEAGE